jgi:hypothetical protein
LSFLILVIGIWDLNNSILEKEELLNQSEFCKLQIGHTTTLASSSGQGCVIYTGNCLK